MPIDQDGAGDIDRGIRPSDHPYEQGKGKFMQHLATKEEDGEYYKERVASGE